MVPFTNCGSEHGAFDASSSGIDTQKLLADLRVQKSTVFAAQCVSCHNQAATDTTLRNLEDTSGLVTAGLIVLGQPQSSPLYLSLVDRFMPPAGSGTLTDGQREVIRNWISAEGGNFDDIIGGGGGGGGGGGMGPATFTQVQQILQQRCLNCHAGQNAPRLDGNAQSLRTQTTTMGPLVVPGNAAGSRLLQSLSRMPTGNPLGVNSAQADVIRRWINGGAL
jgi:uncharacterized membrane protein